MQLKEFNVAEIEAKIGYTFNSKDLLEQAFARRSNPFLPNNEVLEFIGDSVLGMIVTKHLTWRYEEYYTSADTGYYSCELSEGELSEYKISLVQRASLALATDKAELAQYLRLGQSDIANEVQNNASVKEDLFEAILGAVAIDSNWSMPHLEQIVGTLLNIDERLENSELSLVEQEEKLKEKFGAEHVSIEEIESYCSRLQYGYLVKIGDDILNTICEGYGNTKEGALKMAALRAEKSFKKIKDRATTVIEAVGEPVFDRAINQLQELYQKKIIPQPSYSFEEGEKAKNGNPLWICSCEIAETHWISSKYANESKKQAQKYAALDILLCLIGRDMEVIFKKIGPMANTNKED